jgi:hypothetical protein
MTMTNHFVSGHEVPDMISPSSSASGREGKNIDQTPNPNQITDLNQVFKYFQTRDRSYKLFAP